MIISIKMIRRNKHSEYNILKDTSESTSMLNIERGIRENPEFIPNNSNDEVPKDEVLPKIPALKKPVVPWKPGTTLIIGDSMVSGIQEGLLSKNGSVKVRSFPGAIIHDMYNFIAPLMDRKPDRVIIHVGTNDIVYDKTAEEIFSEILQLKLFITSKYHITPVISWPIIRADNDKWTNVVVDLWKLFQKLSIPCIKNDDLSTKMLGTGGRFPGLHLNKWGRARLAMNFLSYIRMP